MNKTKIFNLAYNIKKAKTEKSCAVDRLNWLQIRPNLCFKKYYQKHL